MDQLLQQIAEGNQNVEVALQALIKQQMDAGQSQEAALQALIKVAQDQNLEVPLQALIKMQQEMGQKQEVTNQKLAESVDKMATTFAPIQRFAEMILEGAIPKKGEEYFTEAEAQDFLQRATPVKGTDYFTEEDIASILNRATPVLGTDYFTAEDIASFKKEVSPVKGVDYFDGEAGYTPVKGVDYFDGEKGDKGDTFTFDDLTAAQKRELRGKDAESLSGEKLIKKIEASRSKLDISAIKGWDQMIQSLQNQIDTFAGSAGASGLAGWGGNKTFLELADAPDTYAGAGGQYIRVKSDLSGLEFATVSGGGGGDLGDLDDVTITTIASGEILKWNGSAWINNTLAEAGIAAASHTHTESDITDLGSYIENVVEDTTPQAGGDFDFQSTYDINNVVNIDVEGYIDFAPISAPTHQEGRMYYDSTAKTLVYYNEESEVSMNIGRESWIRVYNDTGSTITNGKAVYISGYDSGNDLPEITLADNSDSVTARFAGVATHDIENASVGYITAFGRVNDLNTSSFTAGNLLWLGTSGNLTETRPTVPARAVIVAEVVKSHASTGSIFVGAASDNGGNERVAVSLFNGSIVETPDVSVSSNGTTVTLTLEQDGGGDLTVLFDQSTIVFDCTPTASVNLTAGSDTSPQINYVYILESTGALTASTSGFPSAEHAPIATVLVQSAASVQTQGAYKVHAWTDHHRSSSTNMGHLAHINYWIRQQNATWIDGVALTPTAGAGTLDIATSSGNVLQLHPHAFPAFDTSSGSTILVVNDPDAAYTEVASLTQSDGVDKDASGNTLGGANNDFYNLVIWGVVSEDSGDCQLMCNLPTEGYPNDNASQAQNDSNQTAVYTIPSVFRGTGFLIARLTVQENAGTYSIIKNTDLRGQTPSQAVGGGVGGGNEFSDNVFRIYDESDNTKQIAFEASSITTATTRTVTVPDADLTMVGTTTTQTITNKTFDGDNNTFSNLDIGNEVDWAVITDVADAGAFESGDKLLIFEAGVGLRKIDYDDLPAGGGGISNVVEDTTPQLGGALDGQGFDLNNMGVLFLTEQAAAEVDVAGKGQLWVQTATPNILMFTDDAGTDFEVLMDADIGTTVQAYDADLDTWATLTPSANAQSLVTAANYAAMRALLDLEAGTDFYSISAANAAFQPLDSELSAIAGLTSAADTAPYFTGSGTAALMTVTSAARSILDDTSTANIRTTLGVGTGSSPQFTAINLGHASDTTLARIAAGRVSIEGVEIATLTGTQTLTNKTLGATTLSGAITAADNDITGIDQLDYDFATGAVSALGNLGATEAIDWSTATHFTGTLDSNVTITHSNEGTGQTITLYLAYDATAQRTITWSNVDKWAGGSAPTAPSASGEVLVVTMTFDGTTCYATGEIFS